MCAPSAILAELIKIIHEGRLLSNANAYDGMRHRLKQN